jgi:hypothetical protein
VHLQFLGVIAPYTYAIAHFVVIYLFSFRAAKISKAELKKELKCSFSNDRAQEKQSSS